MVGLLAGGGAATVVGGVTALASNAEYDERKDRRDYLDFEIRKLERSRRNKRSESEPRIGLAGGPAGRPGLSLQVTF